MNKYIWLLTAILFFSTASIASAHTGLESSVPKDGDVVKENISKITLTFETKIENLSTMKVTRDGKPVDIKTAVNDKVLTGTSPDPLENGKYNVDYKIIGADGHVIEKGLSFTVNKPEEKKEVKKEPEKNTEKAPAAKQKEKSEQKAEKTESKTNSSAPVFIVIVVIVIAIAVWLIKRKKK
ncbi:copper resistance CopC family protein [Fictibacillus fluitans]|uniref:Copper resistance protein CopC n=1 Tax=Fictibacillus fluitans TaxID=3058422 RepID=A0ABT8HTI9_9BACL|nr:copper resistance CopC family protein [Fictibacillus sp. NE201]MDN4523790.1 copper resistance protein CopC [Fictibacillus sp. NE201]